MLPITSCSEDRPADKSAQDALVDIIAGAFRVFDHTLFHRRVTPILRDLGLTTPEDALRLTIL